jgi:hypothetical protein
LHAGLLPVCAVCKAQELAQLLDRVLRRVQGVRDSPASPTADPSRRLRSHQTLVLTMPVHLPRRFRPPPDFNPSLDKPLLDHKYGPFNPTVGCARLVVPFVACGDLSGSAQPPAPAAGCCAVALGGDGLPRASQVRPRHAVPARGRALRRGRQRL